MTQFIRRLLATVVHGTVTCVFLGALAEPAHAELQVNPLWISFKNVEVGDRWVTKSIDVFNWGPDVIHYFLVQNDCGSDVIVHNKCVHPLFPQQRCKINVDFWPHRTGYYRCTIHLSSQRGDSFRISVTGDAVDRR